MKKIPFLILMLLFSVATFAQDDVKVAKAVTPKVIAVINTASWCPACQANGKRVETDIVGSYAGDENISFLVNDKSNKKTKKESKATLEKEGVYKSVKKIKSTGLIILVNAETKEVIKKLSVTTSTEDLKKEINAAINS